MKIIGRKDGETYYRFDDEQDMYDFIYKRFHKNLFEERGEDIHIPDWIIDCVFEIVEDNSIDLATSLGFIDKAIKGVTEHINSDDSIENKGGM